MATDLATLAIKIENGDVVKATTSLNSMEVAGSKAEASTQRLTRRMALLEIQAREMDATMAKNATTLGRLKSTMESAEKVVPGLTHALEALSVVAALGFIGHKTIEETELAQAAMAQLEAAVKATGGAAGRSVEQLDELSKALQKQTTYSDEAVKGAEAVLLTFNKIKGDQFDRATVAVTDLATRMGRDLPEAALQVGKALQDPVEGLQALQRLGVRFSASQKDVIRDLVDTGHAAEAQEIILGKLESTFGGSAAAARDTLGGALKALENAWGDLFEVSRGASQGTVSAINAITKSLEDSGLSMNSFVLNTVVGWEKIKAAAQEANEIMSLQIGPGFFERAKAISERIQNHLNTTIFDLNQPAKTGPTGAGTTGAGGNELTDTAKKFAELVAQRDAEIAKVAALNAAYRESKVTLALLGLEYDAQAKKSENAQGHTARETAILNARTDALTRQKVAQVLLNDQLERERRLQAARDQNTGAIEAALHARDRADLSAPDAELQAIRDRATEEISAARQAHDQKGELRADEQATEDAMLRERITNIKATTAAEIDGIQRARQAATDLSIGISVRDTDAQTAGLRAMIAAELEGGKAAEEMRVRLAGNDAVQRAVNEATATGATVTDEQAAALRRTAEEYERTSIAAEKLRAIQQEVSAAVNQFFTDVFSRKNPGPALAQQIKGAIVAAVAQPIEAKITATVAHILGLDEQLSKQQQAAKDMNTAADKMLKASQIYAGQTPAEAPAGTAGGTESARAAALRAYFRQIAGVAGAGLGGYGAGYGIAQATGSGAIGAIGGAVAGAKLGAAFGAPGVVVGALAGFAGGIIGASDAAKEAAARLEEARREFKNSWDGIIADINGDELAKAILGADDKFQQLRQQYLDTLTFSDIVHGKYKDGLQQITVLEAQYVAQLQQEAAQKARSRIESYQERELRAEGKTAEADALHAKEERQELIDSFGAEIDATERQILAAYDAAAAAEKNTAAINGLTTAVRGGPSGFKLAGYIQEFAKGRPYPGQFQLPTNPFLPPMSPLTPPSLTRTVATAPAMTVTLHNPTFTFPNAKDGPTVAKAFLAELDKFAAQDGGLNGSRGRALEKMPS